ncbi:glycerol-3-phosphate responsive antiterminator [Oceanobacillus sp. SE10311]|uniref:glycerol-3-phosphate responsive antiterminator n=1 Tax=Oceanobacillus sp. MO10714A TaxID=3098290 RepID=UPI00300E0128
MFKDKVIPAIRKIKDFEKVLESGHETIILLESRVSQLQNLVKYAHQYGKKIYVHADLISGLKADKYGIEFLTNNVKVDGIISTRGEVISLVKKRLGHN